MGTACAAAAWCLSFLPVMPLDERDRTSKSTPAKTNEAEIPPFDPVQQNEELST
jgi:hypothetical protein